MRIDLVTPSYQVMPLRAAEQKAPAPTVAPTSDSRDAGSAGAASSGTALGAGPAATLEISPEGRAAYEASVASAKSVDGAPKTDRVTGLGECETCSNRKYVDSSNDSTVSFQTPARIHPREAMSKVAAHEGEHVRNEKARADADGRVVVSQSVSYQTSVCPECGKTYVSGGETRTVTASANQRNQGGGLPGGIYKEGMSYAVPESALDLSA